MHKLKNWLKNKSPKELFLLLVLVYFIVIVIIGLFFVIGRITLLETAITYGVLVAALLPLVHGYGKK